MYKLAACQVSWLASVRLLGTKALCARRFGPLRLHTDVPGCSPASWLVWHKVLQAGR